MERLRTVSRMLDELTAADPDSGLAGDGFSTPLGDLEELDDAWLLRWSCPARDDVELQLAGRRLLGRAERRRPSARVSCAAPPAGYVLEVMLPGEVEPDSVEASLDDGVLTIRVAKPEAERGGQRRIAIEGYA